MRYIVIFLVLANLGYFGWRLYFPATALPAETTAARPLLNQGLVLLSEYNAQAAAQTAANPARLCYLVGDFLSVDDASSFLSVVESAGYRALLQLEGEPLPPNYRVYLPPMSSREVATITLDGLGERLDEQGLQIESYLITRGALENGVALGVFESQSSAAAIRDQVANLGYNVAIEEIPRSSGAVQLLLAKSDFSALDIAEWLDFAGDRVDLTYSENLCETIAQGVQFP